MSFCRAFVASGLSKKCPATVKNYLFSSELVWGPASLEKVIIGKIILHFFYNTFSAKLGRTQEINNF